MSKGVESIYIYIFLTFTGVFFHASTRTFTSVQVRRWILCATYDSSAIVFSAGEDIGSEAGTLPVSLQLNIHISLLAVCGSAYRWDKGRVGGGRRDGGRRWRVHRQLTPERRCVFEAHLHSRLQGGGRKKKKVRASTASAEARASGLILTGLAAAAAAASLSLNFA